MLTHQFEFAAGTIVGRDHVGHDGFVRGCNNHDGTGLLVTDSTLIAVVSDGCGSRPHSEVGAKLTVRLLQSIIRSLLDERSLSGDPEAQAAFWERVMRQYTARIANLAYDMAGGGSFSEVIGDYFLCTALVALITPEVTQVVSVGDGVYAVNGEFSELTPDEGNEPRYPAYRLLPRKLLSEEDLSFRVNCTMETSQLQSLLIGTDGLSALIRAAGESRTLPGRETPLGGLSQFWENDRYFRNPDAVRRQLALANSEVKRLNTEGAFEFFPGLLKDDTSLVVIRRKPNPGP